MKARLIDNRTSVILPGVEHEKEPVETDETIADATEVEQVDEPLSTAEAVHNTDNNTITIVLKTGEELTIREPRAKDFLEAEAWIGNVGESRQSPTFLLLKLALICATFRKEGKIIPKLKTEEFLDLLDDFETMEQVGKAIGFFRQPIEKYFQRLQDKFKELDLELPG
jgi:hypothetical protein